MVCEKISGYWKSKGASVNLITYFPTPLEWITWCNNYNETYISKVFTDTPLPDYITETKHIHIGGTGFYFDNAPNLPHEIEHHMPDYNLYNNWIKQQTESAQEELQRKGKSFNEKNFLKQFKNYTDYSIGFITRGCFRKCQFCVNKKFDHVFPHSPLDEFYDASRKKLCFLDDNFLGCPNWKSMLTEIIATNKPFKFMQGLDERILTEAKAEMLFNANYDGDYIFAFDNISDYDLIHKKLEIINKYNTKNKRVKFYVLVGFESVDAKDIENAFKRIALLLQYNCLPYIMRYMGKGHAPWQHSEYRTLYITLARWCNQPNMIRKMTFREFCEANQKLHKSHGYCSSFKSMIDFEKQYPSIAKQYFDLKLQGE